MMQHKVFVTSVSTIAYVVSSVGSSADGLSAKSCVINEPPGATLRLTNTSPQSPLLTNSALILNGKTTTRNQNFLAQFNLLSDTISDKSGGAVALDVDAKGSAKSGGIWSAALSVGVERGFRTDLHSIFDLEGDINNFAADYGDRGGTNSIGLSLNGLGYRNTAGIYVNNMQQTFAAGGASEPGELVIRFSVGVPAWIHTGAAVQDLTTPNAIPAGTKVASTTGSTIALSSKLAAPGIASGDSIIVSQPLWYNGIIFVPHAVDRYAIRDQSQAFTSLKIEGEHSFGVDVSKAKILGAGMLLGLGPSQGVSTSIGDVTYPMIYGAGKDAYIGNRDSGKIFANGTILPPVAGTYAIGSRKAYYNSTYTSHLVGAGPHPFVSPRADLSDDASDLHGTVTEHSVGDGFTLSFRSTRQYQADCIVSSPSGTAIESYQTTKRSLSVRHAAGTGTFTYICAGE